MLKYLVAAAGVAAAAASSGVRGAKQQLLDAVSGEEAATATDLACDAATHMAKGVTAHEKYAAILTAVQALPKGTWDADNALFRVQDVEWPREMEIINGMGAYYAGGRWGGKCLAQVYLSRSDTTALEECKAVSVRAGEVQTYPRLIITAFYAGTQYYDLTDKNLAALAKAAGLPENTAETEKWHELQSGNKESFTQAVGRAVVASGVKALLVTSKAHAGGTNMVVFPGDAPKSVLQVDDTERLDNLIRMGTMTDAQIATARGGVTEPVVEVGYPNKAADGKITWTDNPMNCKAHCKPK